MKTPKTIKVQIYAHATYATNSLVLPTDQLSSLFYLLNGTKDLETNVTICKADLYEATTHSQRTGNDTRQFYINGPRFDFVFYGYKHSKAEDTMIRELCNKLVKFINE